MSIQCSVNISLQQLWHVTRRKVWFRVQGHCIEFKVVRDDEPDPVMIRVQRETAAVVLDAEMDRKSTSFILADIVANCSSSPNENWFTLIHTQVYDSFLGHLLTL